MNWLMADSTLDESAAGAPTLTVTGPEVVVTPVSVSEIPATAPVSVFELEAPGTPSIAYLASWPCLARPVCSDRTPAAPDTAMKPEPVAPVARVETARVPESVAEAYTVAV